MPSASDRLAAFKEAFSSARMETYEIAAGGDPEGTLDLYAWNIDIAAAFLEDLSVFEVLLRNALDRSLREKYQTTRDSEAWYDQNFLLNTPTPMIEDAIKSVSDGVDSIPPQDDVIAALPFGFWLALLSPGYDRIHLWSEALKNAFPYTRPGTTAKRPDIYDCVADLHNLRNGIAHHEAIFDWSFDRSVRNLTLVATTISPKIEKWIAERSRVAKVLERDPLHRAFQTSRS